MKENTTMKKTVYVGTGRYGKVYLFIEIKQGKLGECLSISGVEGPTADGNAKGSCGQCCKAISGLTHYELSIRDVARISEIWDRWHLNDLRAGSPDQEAYLRLHPISAPYPNSYYDVACAVLADAGLNPDPATGYKYGHSWLHEVLPSDVVSFLEGLPATSDCPWKK